MKVFPKAQSYSKVTHLLTTSMLLQSKYVHFVNLITQNEKDIF